MFNMAVFPDLIFFVMNSTNNFKICWKSDSKMIWKQKSYTKSEHQQTNSGILQRLLPVFTHFETRHWGKQHMLSMTYALPTLVNIYPKF